MRSSEDRHHAIGARRVFRNNSFLVLGWVLIAVGTGGGLLAVLLGNVSAAICGGLAGVLTAACGWLVYARPRVIADDRGVRVVNPSRTTLIAWSQIERFDAHTTLQVVLRAQEPSSVRVWAVQAANVARMFGITSHADRVATDLNDMLAQRLGVSTPPITADSAEGRAGMRWVAISFALLVLTVAAARILAH